MFSSRLTSKLNRVRFNSNHAQPVAEESMSISDIANTDFASPIWRNTIIFGVLSYAVYRFDNNYASTHDGVGYFSSIIDYYRPQEGLWEGRNVRHFELGREAAAQRILLQSAERPPVRQLRYPAALDLGSPWNTRVDQIVNKDSTKVKQHGEVATA